MKSFAVSVATLMLAVGVVADDKVFVPAPDVDWSSMAPYVEASLRVDYAEGELSVGAGGYPYERLLFEPYDPALGEFASVLIVEGIGRRSISKSVKSASKALRSAGVDPSSMSRDDLTAALWQELTTNTPFMERLEQLYGQARERGRLECTICSNGFEPEHIATQ